MEITVTTLHPPRNQRFCTLHTVFDKVFVAGILMWSLAYFLEFLHFSRPI